ncbi:ATP-dependent sacrificial sulfur transferase LarE [Candidatus Latescibacterota bacterium]
MTTPVHLEPLSADDTRTLDEKLADLESILRPLGRVLVGYSGGVDSAMLVVAAHRVLGDDVTAVTADSESYATGELELAGQILEPFGIRHVVVKTHELDNPDYASNPINRCYFCKQELFSQMQKVAAGQGAQTILYGNNADDTGDFRPGSQAARESGARAPLQEAGLTKQDVRDLARRWDLPVWNRPAMACLSSRFPYGTPVTAEGLRMVDRAEKYVRGLGYEQLRVRHHDEVARIELPAEEISDLLADGVRCADLSRELREIGYTSVSVDLRGFRSGSLNEVLQEGTVEESEVEERAVSEAASLDISPAAAHRHDQVLRLQVSADAVTRLADASRRAALVQKLEALGARYVSLDLQPLD